MQGRIQAVLSGARFPADVAAQCGASRTRTRAWPWSRRPCPTDHVSCHHGGHWRADQLVDTVNTAQTGYVVERKVAPGGYDHLANAPGAATRTYTDSAPVVGQRTAMWSTAGERLDHRASRQRRVCRWAHRQDLGEAYLFRVKERWGKVV